MMARLDNTFRLLAISEEGLVHDERDALVFLASDRAVPATLLFYRGERARLGATAEQIADIDRLIVRLRRWQAAHLGLGRGLDGPGALVRGDDTERIIDPLQEEKLPF